MQNSGLRRFRRNRLHSAGRTNIGTFHEFKNLCTFIVIEYFHCVYLSYLSCSQQNVFMTYQINLCNKHGYSAKGIKN